MNGYIDLELVKCRNTIGEQSNQIAELKAELLNAAKVIDDCCDEYYRQTEPVDAYIAKLKVIGGEGEQKISIT